MRCLLLLCLALSCRPASAGVFGGEPATQVPEPGDMAEAQRVFDRLRAAAGDSAKGLGLAFVASAKANAHYSDAARSVLVDAGFLTAFRGDEPLTAYVLAHELGHARQFQLGMFDGRWRIQQLEAHADLLAQELAEKAGYDEKAIERAALRYFGCQAHAPTDALVRWFGEHPMNRDRCVNMIAYEPALEALRKAADTDVLSPRVFDERGRTRPSLLIPPGAKEPLVASLYRDPREGVLSDPSVPVFASPVLVRARNKRLNALAPAAVDAALDSIIEPPDALARVRSPETSAALQRSIAQGVERAWDGDPAWLKAQARRLGLLEGWRNDTR